MVASAGKTDGVRIIDFEIIEKQTLKKYLRSLDTFADLLRVATLFFFGKTKCHVFLSNDEVDHFRG
jgi:hypothetical protein